ncbi:unnamed protein product, partial [Ectocarpus sp. 12 AP-2014]
LEDFCKCLKAHVLKKEGSSSRGSSRRYSKHTHKTCGTPFGFTAILRSPLSSSRPLSLAGRSVGPRHARASSDLGLAACCDDKAPVRKCRHVRSFVVAVVVVVVVAVVSLPQPVLPSATRRYTSVFRDQVYIQVLSQTYQICFVGHVQNPTKT